MELLLVDTNPPYTHGVGGALPSHFLKMQSRLTNQQSIDLPVELWVLIAQWCDGRSLSALLCSGSRRLTAVAQEAWRAACKRQSSKLPAPILTTCNSLDVSLQQSHRRPCLWSARLHGLTLRTAETVPTQDDASMRQGINEYSRSILVDFLLDTSSSLKLDDIILDKAVRILDAFLTKEPIMVTFQLHKTGLACLLKALQLHADLVGSKSAVSTMMQPLYTGCYTCVSHDEVISAASRVEQLVPPALLSAPTASHFLREYLQQWAAELEVSALDMCYVMMLARSWLCMAMLDHQYTLQAPSLIAAASMARALEDAGIQAITRLPCLPKDQSAISPADASLPCTAAQPMSQGAADSVVITPCCGLFSVCPPSCVLSRWARQQHGTAAHVDESAIPPPAAAGVPAGIGATAAVTTAQEHAATCTLMSDAAELPLHQHGALQPMEGSMGPAGLVQGPAGPSPPPSEQGPAVVAAAVQRRGLPGYSVGLASGRHAAAVGLPDAAPVQSCSSQVHVARCQLVAPWWPLSLASFVGYTAAEVDACRRQLWSAHVWRFHGCLCQLRWRHISRAYLPMGLTKRTARSLAASTRLAHVPNLLSTLEKPCPQHHVEQSRDYFIEQARLARQPEQLNAQGA